LGDLVLAQNERVITILAKNTVEPLYNGRFGTSHFWVIFVVI